ncbi:hypothetical protein SYNPS1DRAFT_28663 [Syncephalis pseudoplumigaleata]|uniref:Mid2 domain-containing protein n=1 Tax=Syncephalis pseudoplumigaleata TaxID=1712513 RepID=A0A4P9Z011_9FUNG|nr:hypothetical protein SYNPS1DRAFT_28663 [Syncephalis pseudoplumigaleata]|eukprot:RKP25608.1 hypothetical protein SYNPS1DRAFT_28663 [Syncephalis pseudoplumigaleata]
MKLFGAVFPIKSSLHLPLSLVLLLLLLLIGIDGHAQAQEALSPGDPQLADSRPVLSTPIRHLPPATTTTTVATITARPPSSASSLSPTTITSPSVRKPSAPTTTSSPSPSPTTTTATTTPPSAEAAPTPQSTSPESRTQQLNESGEGSEAEAASQPRRSISKVSIACIVVIPTLVVGLGIGLAISLYIRRRRRAHANKGTDYSTGDDTLGTRGTARTNTSRSNPPPAQQPQPQQQQQQRTRRIFRGGSLDLRRSAAVTRSIGRSGVPQTWNSRSRSFSDAIHRPAAVPAPAMLETGKASGVLSDAAAFPPVPGPSRPLERRARAGLGDSRAASNRWTVTIDTSDMQVVPLPPPNYKEALKEPPAAADV